MRSTHWLNTQVIWLCFFLSSAACAKAQVISASADTSLITQGGKFTVKVVYTSSNNDLTTGLGLNLHYDSSKLLQPTIVYMLDTNSLGSQFEQDINDLDNTSATDKLFSANWADFGGKWPLDEEFPVTLFTIMFDASNDFTDTVINFSKNTGAAGYDFSADSLSLLLDPLSIDTDSDGLTDTQESNYGTNPLIKDSDSDGFSDFEEIIEGTDPLDAKSLPKSGLSLALIQAFLDKQKAEQ